MFGRFLTSVLWGMIADRYGRKPVVLFGTVITLVLLTALTFVVIVKFLHLDALYQISIPAPCMILFCFNLIFYFMIMRIRKLLIIISG